MKSVRGPLAIDIRRPAPEPPPLRKVALVGFVLGLRLHFRRRGTALRRVAAAAAQLTLAQLTPIRRRFARTRSRRADRAEWSTRLDSRSRSRYVSIESCNVVLAKTRELKLKTRELRASHFLVIRMHRKFWGWNFLPPMFRLPTLSRAT